MANVEDEIAALRRIAEFHGNTNKRVVFYTWNPAWDAALNTFVAKDNFVISLDFVSATTHRRGYDIYQGDCDPENIAPSSKEWARTLRLPKGTAIPLRVFDGH